MTVSNFLPKLEFVAGSLLLAVITCLVFMAAVMRFMGTPLIWSVDLAQLLFIWLCFIGATRAMRQRAHLGVDFLVRLLPHQGRLAVEMVLALIILMFLAALMWHGYKLTVLNIEREFGDSGLSYAFVTAAVPIGCFMLSLSIMANMIQAWNGRRTEGPLIFARVAGKSTPSVSEL